MENLLQSVDFGVDFDMDTDIDLDCLSSSDDLLDLNEDDLLNFELLTNSEYEDSDGQEVNDIDSYFVHENSQLNDDKELKNINCILNSLTTSKDISLNSSLNSPLNSSINGSINNSMNSSINSSLLTTSLNSSVNNLFLINGLNLPSQPSQLSNLNSNCLNSNCLNSSIQNNNDLNNCTNLNGNISNSNLISNLKRSQNQCFLNKESEDSLTDDSYESSEDDSSTLDNDEISQLTIGNQKIPISINYFNLNKKMNQDKFIILAKNQFKNHQSKSKIGTKQTDHRIVKRKLSSSKGVSLLAKPKKIKKTENDLNQLTNENYGKFLNYFYQDHNYCLNYV